MSKYDTLFALCSSPSALSAPLLYFNDSFFFPDGEAEL